MLHFLHLGLETAHFNLVVAKIILTLWMSMLGTIFITSRLDNLNQTRRESGSLLVSQ